MKVRTTAKKLLSFFITLAMLAGIVAFTPVVAGGSGAPAPFLAPLGAIEAIGDNQGWNISDAKTITDSKYLVVQVGNNSVWGIGGAQIIMQGNANWGWGQTDITTAGGWHGDLNMTGGAFFVFDITTFGNFNDQAAGESTRIFFNGNNVRPFTVFDSGTATVNATNAWLTNYDIVKTSFTPINGTSNTWFTTTLNWAAYCDNCGKIDTSCTCDPGGGGGADCIEIPASALVGRNTNHNAGVFTKTAGNNWAGITFPANIGSATLADYESLTLTYTGVAGDYNFKNTLLAAGSGAWTDNALNNAASGLGAGNQTAVQVASGNASSGANLTYALSTLTQTLTGTVHFAFSPNGSMCERQAGHQNDVTGDVSHPCNDNSCAKTAFSVTNIKLNAKGCNDDCATCDPGTGSGTTFESVFGTEGTIVKLPAMNWQSGDNPNNQRGWNNTALSAANLNAAKYFILEVDNLPTGSGFALFIGAAGWDQEDAVIKEVKEGRFMVIDLGATFGPLSLGGSFSQFGISYWGWQTVLDIAALGIQGAWLFTPPVEPNEPNDANCVLIPVANLTGNNADIAINNNIATITNSAGHNHSFVAFSASLPAEVTLGDFNNVTLTWQGVSGDHDWKNIRLHAGSSAFTAALTDNATEANGWNPFATGPYIVGHTPKLNSTTPITATIPLANAGLLGLDGTVYFAMSIHADSGASFNLSNIRFNAKGCTGTCLTCDPPTAPTITTNATLASAPANSPFGRILAASGSTPITWKLCDVASPSSLPPGLSLAANGLISGTPTQTGTFVFTAIATNLAGSDSREFTITINAAGPDTGNIGGGTGGGDGGSGGGSSNIGVITVGTVAEPGAALVLPSGFTIPQSSADAIRGPALLPAVPLQSTGAGNQTINFGTDADVAGQNAILIKIVDGRVEFVSAAVIGSNGSATVNVPGGGDYLVLARQTGDITGTGTVDTTDAMTLLMSLANLVTLDPVQQFVANGKTAAANTNDVMQILKLIAGLIDKI
jgi:hypothetical protein